MSKTKLEISTVISHVDPCSGNYEVILNLPEVLFQFNQINIFNGVYYDCQKFNMVNIELQEQKKHVSTITLSYYKNTLSNLNS